MSGRVNKLFFILLQGPPVFIQSERFTDQQNQQSSQQFRQVPNIIFYGLSHAATNNC